MATLPPPVDGEVLYKVTTPDGSPLHGGSGRWSLPHGKRPGAWRSVEGSLVMCQNGLHIVTKDQLPRWMPEHMPFTVWEVEVHAKAVRQSDYDKSAVSRARLVRPVVSIPRGLVYNWSKFCEQQRIHYPSLEDVASFLASKGDIIKSIREQERRSRAAMRRYRAAEKKRWGYDETRLVFGRDRAKGDVWCPAWPQDFERVMLGQTLRKGRQTLGLRPGQDRLVINAWKAKQDLDPYLRLVGVSVVGKQVAA